jgi:DnaJ-domain-containing protein 1
MGVGRRILDLARANLNALLDRAQRTELEGMSERELLEELERRKRERSAQDEERERRRAAEAAAKQRAQTRARTTGKSGGGRAAPARTDPFHTLGVRRGASLEEVKRAYRALMREHHPDRHAGDPARQRAASERAAVITLAYTEITRRK